MAIIFDVEGMIEEARKNPCTAIDRRVCPAHVTKVWEAISVFIMEQFTLGHGVRIPELATISYKIFATDVSQRNVIVDKIPIINISEYVVKQYNLLTKRPTFNLDVPETSLNLSAIAEMVGVSRSIAETCVDEVIQAFHRAINQDSHVEFHFPGIGKMVVNCKEVHSKFDNNFLCKYGFGEDTIMDRCCAKYVENC